MGRFRRKISGLLVTGALSLGTAQHALACAFHGYIPDPTLVDILLGTEQVVIAQPRSSDPDRYVILETLLGPDGIEIPLTVSPETREDLEEGDGDTVLIARDGAYGPWLELAVMDDRYRQIVEQVIARQSTWVFGGDEERFQMFAALANDPNPAIRYLALGELDRADYSILRELDIPQIDSLRAEVTIADDGLRPIRVLLAGLSDDQSYVELLKQEMSVAVADNRPYLGAYATALIELQGPRAVQSIVQHHFADETLPLETHERLMEAFAIKNQTADMITKQAILNGVDEVLFNAPQLAGAAARQFGFRSDWSMAEPITRARMAHQPTTIEDLFALNQYIGLAKEAGKER
jgi:hypothetical protein